MSRVIVRVRGVAVVSVGTHFLFCSFSLRYVVCLDLQTCPLLFCFLRAHIVVSFNDLDRRLRLRSLGASAGDERTLRDNTERFNKNTKLKNVKKVKALK